MLLNHIAAAPASLPPTEMDRIEALRAALVRVTEVAGSSTLQWHIAADALDADGRAAAAQDEAQMACPECGEPGAGFGHVAGPCPPHDRTATFGWQPGRGFIRELPERPANFMEPIL